MPFYCGYHTDDLTDRQNAMFHKLNNGLKPGCVSMMALNFMEHCAKTNYANNQFDDYDGDCDWLLKHREKCEELGIDLDNLYN